MDQGHMLWLWFLMLLHVQQPQAIAWYYDNIIGMFLKQVDNSGF